MATKSTVVKMKRVRALVAKYAEKRRTLKAAGDWAGLAKLPRNSSRTRVRNLCELTGRSKAVYRKFKLCRLKLRELALEGKIPGMRKSSW